MSAPSSSGWHEPSDWLAEANGLRTSLSTVRRALGLAPGGPPRDAASAVDALESWLARARLEWPTGEHAVAPLVSPLAELLVVASLPPVSHVHNVAEVVDLVERVARKLRYHAEEDDLHRRDLRRAGELQAAMLVGKVPAARLTFDHVYRPLEAIGGDYFDVHRLSNDKTRLFVADIAGHGVRAAMSTMLLKAEYEAEKRSTPHARDLLYRLNSALLRRFPARSLVLTAVCVDIEGATGRFDYATAAHPSPLRVGSETVALDTGGAFIGISRRADFFHGSGTLAEGDGLYLLTDGVIDACDPSGEMYGEERALAALSVSPTAGANELYADVLAFVAGRAPADDLAILGARLRSPTA